MNWRTQRLAALLPDSYAAREPGSLLHRLLDAFGHELLAADAGVGSVLRSHWVEFATGAALDGLAATFAIERRTLADGAVESDAAFRQRLRSLVTLYTGGGTVRAVIGAVQSALGFPFDLDDLPLPPDAEGLRDDLRRLVTLTEFAPDTTEVLASASAATVEAERTRLDLAVELGTARPEPPRIEVAVLLGVARNLSIELEGTGQGVRGQPAFGVGRGDVLIVETDPARGFSARVEGAAGTRNVSHQFTALDSGAPRPPPVPGARHNWIVRAGSGFADNGQYSAFDEDTFDLPLFDVRMRWVRYQPLTFEVSVPYFLHETVEALADRHGYAGRVFVFSGLPREHLQDVVDQTRAAGVQGRISFSLNLADNHRVREVFSGASRLRAAEDAATQETLGVGSVSTLPLEHDQIESLRIGGVFDISTFDDDHQGFLG